VVRADSTVAPPLEKPMMAMRFGSMSARAAIAVSAV
jgi:hypothetical protein